MKSTTLVLLSAGAIAVSVSTFILFSRTSDESLPALVAGPQRVERGRYLVHQVGLCIDCHSPRDQNGQFIADRHLAGAPIPFQPVAQMPWMPVAPRIAGLPAGFTPEETIHFLMTGERPGGRAAPLPPMPPYRLNRDDAEAVTAYLASLPSAPR